MSYKLQPISCTNTLHIYKRVQRLYAVYACMRVLLPPDMHYTFLYTLLSHNPQSPLSHSRLSTHTHDALRTLHTTTAHYILVQKIHTLFIFRPFVHTLFIFRVLCTLTKKVLTYLLPYFRLYVHLLHKSVRFPDPSDLFFEFLFFYITFYIYYVIYLYYTFCNTTLFVIQTYYKNTHFCNKKNQNQISTDWGVGFVIITTKYHISPSVIKSKGCARFALLTTLRAMIPYNCNLFYIISYLI